MISDGPGVGRDGAVGAKARKKLHAYVKEDVAPTHVSCHLVGAEYENGNDNENGVEMPFAGSKPPRSSAPIRLKIYRCLVF